ncbi:hypothetical protein NECAME_14173 [Necator americanus]|uniref:Phlebovirus glycoprotein G2 fusion domain-containing protein n=1 Tax=Necator americanus TaxID=51031 RepID=W2SPH2_NECAM|nr:hypothetical protein NECAME_14173 [Necator americanus]ETN71550.1 hypothetical protein NECAME_14173 [Necator americanus]
MARITDTKQSSDGVIREVELITSTRRKIRRPVNLVIPLELGDTDNGTYEKGKNFEILLSFHAIFVAIFNLDAHSKAAIRTIGRISCDSGDISTAVIPNVPIFMHNFTLTMTSLAVPPLPTLNQKFIINDKEYAIWQLDTNPLLFCKSRSDAKHLKCDFSDDCRCGPTESKVRCDCTYPQLSNIFKALSQKLPRQLGSTSFFKNNDSQIVARIRDTASTEFVITFQGKVNRTTQQVNKASAQLRIQF